MMHCLALLNGADVHTSSRLMTEKLQFMQKILHRDVNVSHKELVVNHLQ